TNCHILVEQAPIVGETADAVAEKPVAEFAPNVITISAKTKDALQAYLDSYQQALRMPSLQGANWSDVTFTALTGRQHFRNRASIQARSATEAADRIAALLSQGSAEGVAVSDVGTSLAKVAFMFTGQGAQFA